MVFNLYLQLSSYFFILKPLVLLNKSFAKTFLVNFTYKFNGVKLIDKKIGLKKKYFLNLFFYEKLFNLITHTVFSFNFFRLQSSLNFLLIYNNKKFLSFYYFFKFFSFFFSTSTILKQPYIGKSIKKRIKFLAIINKISVSLKRIKNKVLKRIVKRPFFTSAIESLYGLNKNFSSFFFNSILNLHNNQFFLLNNYKNSLYTFIYLFNDTLLFRKSIF